MTMQRNQSQNARHPLSKFYGSPPELRPIEVKIDTPGDRSSFEKALRNFKILFQRERVVGRLKERSSYEKPSEKKRRKKREAYERRLLADARERMVASGEWEKRQKRKAKKRQQKLEQKLRRQDSTEDLES